MGENILVLDNGAYWAKIGMSSREKPRLVPNCIMKAKSERRRPFIGDQIEECRDASGLFYILPFQKGYLINWDIQKTVWDYMFSKDCCNVNLSESDLIVTEPYFNFSSIQEGMTEIFFEEYEVQSLLRVNAGTLSDYMYCYEHPGAQCCLVVDCGYSFTHVVPYIKGQKVKEAVKRVDVGGKVLTNHLKDVISYRQLHVMDETYVINQAKEDVCFVSNDFMKDMEIARKKGKENTIVRDYVLPDFTSIRRGYVREPGGDEQDAQYLRMNCERFAVPELIFNPSDVGISQMGLSNLITHCISLCPEESHAYLYSNIVLTGGSCLFPGFRSRVEADVRSLAPDLYDVRVHLPSNPITYAWQGGATLAKDNQFRELCVTKTEYDEEGSLIIEEKFDV